MIGRDITRIPDAPVARWIAVSMTTTACDGKAMYRIIGSRRQTGAAGRPLIDPVSGQNLTIMNTAASGASVIQACSGICAQLFRYGFLPGKNTDLTQRH